MESPRKFNDCYFYYYSTCTKGDNCVFRHEPAALGCETMCTAWQQGKCLDKRCKLRHMELRKNRKQIPCYWENQPCGCRKKHCPFMHKNPDARTDGIAPSQPAPLQPAGAASSVPVVEGAPEPPHAGAPPAPAPVPLLWQQQRQVVLESSLLGVLPAPGELLGARRVLPPHAHAHAHDAYPLPVDPLVVNFEEESDNESAPSSTPTKSEGGAQSHELMLLERIQAEAAARYGYDARTYATPTTPTLPAPPERRPSLDFKILSLDEIRARKKAVEAPPIVHTPPITLNLSRKRKLSTHETLTTSGNKIIKVVRSNSIVYKKVDKNAPPAASQTKVDNKQSEESASRKRTLSEQSDFYEIQDDELVDNCYEFKRIKMTEPSTKPRLIRNRSVNKDNSDVEQSKDDEADSSSKVDNDSDSEVQIVSVGMNDTNTDVSTLLDTDIIDVESTRMGDPVAVVDLSDSDGDDVTISDIDLDFGLNVPDVVASCQKTTLLETSGKDLLSSIDAILNDEL